MKFEDYRISIELKTNLKKMGFKRPTDIQFKCIPHIQKGEDLLAIAQTGTGKTAAFAIPILDKIQFIKKKTKTHAIRAIVMVPTRELAIQITNVFHELGRNTKVRTQCIYGGVEQDPQIDALLKGVDIMVTTPGRMFDLASQGYIQMDKVEVVILDEADHMLDLGFYKDIKDLVRYLPNSRQTLFFSATIDEKIKKLAYSLVKNPIRIQISPKDPVSKNVDHSVAFIEMDDKRFFLERLIKENEDLKFLVFVRTKVRAERVTAAMERVQIKSETIHGDKEQRDREEVLSRFKTGKNKILIATDVSARGIDIPDVDYVINYDLPEQAENYVHRVGRTGRGKKRGLALAFCAKNEIEILKQIESYITVPIKRAEIDSSEYQETILFSDDGSNNWKKLLEQEELDKKKKRKGK
ncbi:DEAD/DEAH box helicase [Paracrocinitomix mangrovi]|uniref:DEAD/DEAH box helicase n=1 Tax=Paracrocinitomix mangrovi TaxID=2862509 RepID=UPI001C8D4BA9|nr:DEAD/DEAH box helicase [Paracrocinitomix mangrovi]UKN00775.1 DEAD/DEAH box helicase [Paracrocinitomix mangrovi]